MNFFSGNVAREASRLIGWSDKFWAGPYRMIPVSDDEETQVSRLRYLLANGCKEGLVGSPMEWPGVSTATALVKGDRELRGDWVDRTAICRLRNRGKKTRERDYTEPVVVLLSKLPCWEHLSSEEYRYRMQELVRDIEQEMAQQHKSQGTRPLGSKKVMLQDPQDKPALPKRSPAPAFHAASREALNELRDTYRLFLDVYRSASKLLRSGVRDVCFPEGCFPPALPFVQLERARAPG